MWSWSRTWDTARCNSVSAVVELIHSFQFSCGVSLGSNCSGNICHKLGIWTSQRVRSCVACASLYVWTLMSISHTHISCCQRSQPWQLSAAVAPELPGCVLVCGAVEAVVSKSQWCCWAWWRNWALAPSVTGSGCWHWWHCDHWCWGHWSLGTGCCIWGGWSCCPCCQLCWCSYFREPVRLPAWLKRFINWWVEDSLLSRFLVTFSKQTTAAVVVDVLSELLVSDHSLIISSGYLRWQSSQSNMAWCAVTCHLLLKTPASQSEASIETQQPISPDTASLGLGQASASPGAVRA